MQTNTGLSSQIHFRHTLNSSSRHNHTAHSTWISPRADKQKQCPDLRLLSSKDMKPSTAVTVVSLAVCATLVDARMATEVKRDNATVVEEPKLVKRENW